MGTSGGYVHSRTSETQLEDKTISPDNQPLWTRNDAVFLDFDDKWSIAWSLGLVYILGKYT